jgi:hypothetical protein
LPELVVSVIPALLFEAVGEKAVMVPLLLTLPP